MRRRLVTVTAVALVLLGGCSDDDADDGDSASPPTTASSVPDAVSEVRAAVQDPAGTGGFDSAPIGGDGRVVCVDGASVRLYVFPSEDDAAAAAALIDPDDPSDVGTAIVEWTGTPRFWLDGRALVVYSGDDERLVADLVAGLGEPLSQGIGRGFLPDPGC